MGDTKYAYKLVGRSKGNRPLGRPRCKWEINVTIYLQDVGREEGWIQLAHSKEEWAGRV